MLVNDKYLTSLCYDPARQQVVVIDQTQLPHALELVTLRDTADFCHAITAMQVRGAPLIGITAAYGLALALAVDDSPRHEAVVAEQLLRTRPTAVNLAWAIAQVRAAIASATDRAAAALAAAERLREQDIATCEAIGEHGATLLAPLFSAKQADEPLQILTHCNAGWLATIDWGTALAPIYKLQQQGRPVHVWVDETRPRNQGASLTAWELQQAGIPHTVIADNTGGHLMQQGLVDVCLVGSDRTTANGDVCNKIGTYLKALAARDNRIPFYAALPSSTIDWQLHDGGKIPIEQRDGRELTHMRGIDAGGQWQEIQVIAHSHVANYAFDVTPARLVNGLITEHGLFTADPDGLQHLYRRSQQHA